MWFGVNMALNHRASVEFLPEGEERGFINSGGVLLRPPCEVQQRRILLLLGAPGVGKRTQAHRIALKYGLASLHISGLAQPQSTGTALVDNIRERVRKADCTQGFVLWDFPRTLEQAEALDAILMERGERIGRVVVYDGVPDDVLEERTCSRWIHAKSGRSYHPKHVPPKSFEGWYPTTGNMLDDNTSESLMQSSADTQNLFRSRLRAYSDQSKAVISHYTQCSLVEHVSGAPPPEKVWEGTCLALRRTIVLLIGPQTKGKNEQATSVAKRLNIAHLNCAIALHEALSAGTSGGIGAKTAMKGGGVVSDDNLIDIIKDRIAMPDCQEGFLLDDFPRTQAQALALDRTLAISGEFVTCVVEYAHDENYQHNSWRVLSHYRASRNCRVLPCGHAENRTAQSGAPVPVPADHRILIVYSPPGCGVEELLPLLAEKYGTIPLCVEDLIAEAVGDGTEAGLQAQAVMEGGSLVSTELAIAILKDRIQRADCVHGFILNGFPRSVTQAEALDRMLASCGKRVDRVLELVLPTAVLQDRVLGRWVHRPSGRTYHVRTKPPKSYIRGIPTRANMLDDDTGEPLMRRASHAKSALLERLQSHHDQIEPVLHYSRLSVDVVRMPPDEVVENAWSRPNSMTKRDIRLLLGPPGAGKHTQSRKIVEKHKIPCLSIDNLQQAVLDKGTELSMKVKKVTENGGHIPDDIIVAILEWRIQEKDCQQGFLLSGFPQTVEQAYALDQMLGNEHVSCVIELSVPDVALAERVSGKHKTSGHSYQDNAQSLKLCLKTYHMQTEPILKHYRASSDCRVVWCNGNQEPTMVFAELEHVLM